MDWLSPGNSDVVFCALLANVVHSLQILFAVALLSSLNVAKSLLKKSVAFVHLIVCRTQRQARPLTCPGFYNKWAGRTRARANSCSWSCPPRGLCAVCWYFAEFVFMHPNQDRLLSSQWDCVDASYVRHTGCGTPAM